MSWSSINVSCPVSHPWAIHCSISSACCVSVLRGCGIRVLLVVHQKHSGHMRAASLHHIPPGRCSPVRGVCCLLWQNRAWTCGTQRCSKRTRVAHLRERRAPGDRGSGEHAARPAWPDPARTGQYPLVAARLLEDALAVHLTEWITEQFQSCAIGVTEVERPANLLIR